MSGYQVRLGPATQTPPTTTPSGPVLCDLSQLPDFVLVGAYSGRKPRVLHVPSPSSPSIVRTACGYNASGADWTLSRLLNPVLVRPCKKCFRDYEQPHTVELSSSSVVPTVIISAAPAVPTGSKMAVYGKVYHRMVPRLGWSDAFKPICGEPLLAGKGRLVSESAALESGATLCKSCSRSV